MMLAGRVALDARGSAYGEHLLVWSWRRIVSGRIHCPVMAQEFADACGKAGGEVFRALCSFLEVLAFASRRRLLFCAPDPFGVTADERQVLTLLAAAQTEEHALFEAHMRWLTQPKRRRELQAAAQALASVLKANNLPLALPQPAMPDSSEQLRAVT